MKALRALIVAAAVLVPTILIPADVSSGVSDDSSERELVEAYVRANFVWTGSVNLLFGRWQFADVRTGLRYTMTKGDKFKARFVDGSSVRFRFIGTAIGCPSGLCFVWVVGSERYGERMGRLKHERGHYVYGGEATVVTQAPPNPNDVFYTGGRPW